MSKHIALYENELEFELPDEFETLDAEVCERYFNGQLPEHIYGILEKQAFITVSRKKEALKQESLEKRLNEYYHAYSRSTANFSNGKMVKKALDNGKAIGAFHFSSTTVERNLLNFVVLFDTAGYETIMTMHCGAKDSMKLGKLFMETLDSIRVA